MMRTLLVTVALGSILVGCAQVPKPRAYVLNYQQKMQAAHHWDLLAKDVAGKVVAEYGRAGTAGVYVQPCSGVFGEAFTGLLTTELVQNGVPLAPTANGAAVLSIDVQLVRYQAKWPHRYNRAHPGMWTAVASVIRFADNITKNMIIPAGVAADLLDGSVTTLPKHEVIITTSMAKDGTYLMRQSSLFYVNDADRGQYVDGVPGVPGIPGMTKTLEVVAR